MFRKYSGILRALCNPSIFRTLVYSKPWDTENSIQIRTLSNIYNCCAKVVNSHSSFRKLQLLSLREICPNTELFPVRIFLYLDWIWRFTESISVFSANTGKYGPEITPYLHTFHAVFCKVYCRGPGPRILKYTHVIFSFYNSLIKFIKKMQKNPGFFQEYASLSFSFNSNSNRIL